MWIPHFLPFLQRFGWRLSPAGDGIVRTDENECVRTFVIGVDRLCVLLEWLVEHLQNLALKQCERDVRSLHRRGPTLQSSGKITCTTQKLPLLKLWTDAKTIEKSAIKSGVQKIRNLEWSRTCLEPH